MNMKNLNLNMLSFVLIWRKIKTFQVKELEVYLIDDDNYISGGVYVLNNLPKLNKVGNFSELLARIKKFFDEIG